VPAIWGSLSNDVTKSEIVNYIVLLTTISVKKKKTPAYFVSDKILKRKWQTKYLVLGKMARN